MPPKERTQIRRKEKHHKHQYFEHEEQEGMCACLFILDTRPRIEYNRRKKADQNMYINTIIGRQNEHIYVKIRYTATTYVGMSGKLQADLGRPPQDSQPCILVYCAGKRHRDTYNRMR